MKRIKRIQITLCLLLAITDATPLRAQVSAFTYQGRLDLNGAPANGYHDFMFRLLNDPTNGVAAPGQACELCNNGNRSGGHWRLVLLQHKDWVGGEVWFDGELIRNGGMFLPRELKGLNAQNLK